MSVLGASTKSFQILCVFVVNINTEDLSKLWFALLKQPFTLMISVEDFKRMKPFNNGVLPDYFSFWSCYAET